jgi:hypothetical protein
LTARTHNPGHKLGRFLHADPLAVMPPPGLLGLDDRIDDAEALILKGPIRIGETGTSEDRSGRGVGGVVGQTVLSGVLGAAECEGTAAAGSAESSVLGSGSFAYLPVVGSLYR